jgi:proline iminopeptidase
VLVEWVEHDDARLWTVSSGNGAPLVWCHGGPGLWDYLAPVAAMTPERCVVRWDQRGSGRSSGESDYSVAQCVADLEAIRAHYGFGRWAVGGHSWGAMLALRYAVAHPQRTEALLYISGIGVSPGWRSDYDAALKRRLGPAGVGRLRALRERWHREGIDDAEREYYIAQWSKDFVDPATAEHNARSILVDGLHMNEELNATLWAEAMAVCVGSQAQAEARELDVPALVVHGAGDLRPWWPAQELAELLPRGEFVRLENAAHFPWVEQPEELKTAIRSLLERGSSAPHVRKE